jgi:Ca2+-binding RTX toxin-like protein
MNRFTSPAGPSGRAGRTARAGRRLLRGKRGLALLGVLALAATPALFIGSSSAAPVAPAPAGQGFTVVPSDLAFILKQIKIAERHSRAFEGDATVAPQPNPNPAADPSYCLSMIGQGSDQIPDYLTSYGLRTVDGSCNNLSKVLDLTTANNDHPTPTFANHPTLGAADQPFPRLTSKSFRTAESNPPAFGPPGPVTSYAQKTGGNVVFDSQPRLISNLIVDQTSTNPAAVAAAGFPVRAQNGGNPTVPCQTNPDGTDITPLTPAGCVPRFHTLFIENVTTDVGLSPPYNSLFTFFGQFFDHGVDQTVKSSGTVIVPLRADDPLIAGPDHTVGTPDDLPPQLRFIPLTRAQNQPGPDGVIGTADDVQDANNTDTPWVDQSQTYTSHSSHQFFLREYMSDGNGHPVATGRFLGGLPAGQTYFNSPDGTTGISTWASTKKQAHDLLGLELRDTDVTNVPTILTDPYGNYIPGPARGLPQYVTKTGLVEGDLANPVPVPANVLYFDTPFLTDIAHNADPGTVGPCTTPIGVTPRVPAGCLSPDANNTPSADFAAQPPGTYDDEMLNAHFTCGDGRCNENIALSTIHQVFHSEHNRLSDEFHNVTLPANPDLSAAYHATNCPIGCATNDPTKPITYTYGQRLFQAARFVTEMEYQHLVFEEFARKLVPAIRPFHVYSPDINPAIKAEFAHAVYRFGHSMLDDDVARTTVDPVTGAKTPNDLPLLDAFLNPPEYFNSHGQLPGPYTPEQAGGAIVMGSTDQAGNELDEFINDTLRNNLLGLPLDLATFNIARARSEGIPPLNQVRRELHAQTNDGALAPYTSWADYGQHLKHPESLINFVAAYGTHSSITSVDTVAGKRAAARAIVDPLPTDTPPCDAAAFMFGTNGVDPVNCPSGTDWTTGPDGITKTGLDTVDLWDGGLAEVTNLNGSLLGSTFNYVFQNQLENLQDGDRFYYLARTPGLNLRTQLEGNSFAEMIERNTDGTNTLKADVFATADCKFQIGNITTYSGLPTISGSATPPIAALTGADAVNDDPSTDCDENQLLLKKPTDGTVQYRLINHIDPAGINGQSVYNGTSGPDRIFGGNDNDTFWGNLGKDVIEGNNGDDVAFGGDDNDILTDLNGADILEGGNGNDAIDGGPGDDLATGNNGVDFINGGANDNETFAGPGNDFVNAGQGADAVFGDGGDDWIQGGSGQDLLQGDHGAPFFDDPAQSNPGNDIFVGQVGENDYDTEGGDDLMAQNAAIDRNAGAAGFDWAFHQYDTVGADDDMMINQQLFGVPIQIVVNRDRWQETEADSGSNLNDILRGDDLERVVGPAGFSGCDALDPTGVARINGLDKLVTRFPSSLQEVFDVSINKYCPLVGFGGATNPDGSPVLGSGTVWAEGNILIGGGGSDRIEGRGNDDIIDGDHMLHVRISVRANPDGTGAELGWTDLMEGTAKSGDFGPGTTGLTLHDAVFKGLVDPGQLVAVRELINPDGAAMGATPDNNLLGDCGTATPSNCDTAIYSTPLIDPATNTPNYTIVKNADGSVTVADNASVAAGGLFAKGDGTDTLWNIEQLRFCTGNDPVSKNCNAFETFSVDAARDLATPVPPAPAPVIRVSPATVSFGNQQVATTSAPTVITVSNIGNADLNVTDIAVDVGPDAASFAVVPGCAAPVAPAGTCTFSVTFSPASAGAKAATVSVTSNAVASPFAINVLGTGTVTATPPPAAPPVVGVDLAPPPSGGGSDPTPLAGPLTGGPTTGGGSTTGGGTSKSNGIVSLGLVRISMANSITKSSLKTGIPVSVKVPKKVKVLRFRVLSSRHKVLFVAFHNVKAGQKVKFNLRSAALLGKLAAGKRYILEVTPGTSTTALGKPSVSTFLVQKR